MDTVTVCPDFSVTLPKRVRDALRLRPGAQVDVFVHDGRIEMIPVRPIVEMRGFLAGIDTTVERDADRL